MNDKQAKESLLVQAFDVAPSQRAPLPRPALSICRVPPASLGMRLSLALPH